jgi:hypothetical protein
MENFNIMDYLSFRKMITPLIIQILFWIGVAFSVIGGLAILIMGFSEGGGYVLSGLGTMIFGPFVVRIYCELLILFFRMNETLTDISNKLDK